MVYPDDYIPSNEGSREIIDGSDLSFPFILLVRHGSSDHVQPNFPSPGQIRSMFNTDKINECPEYASSPSTMSDPLEWRPTSQMEMLEERLMRIHQWNDNTSFLNRNYEGQGVTITDLNPVSETNTDVVSVENNAYNGDSPAGEAAYNFPSDQRVFDNDYETHSELSGRSEPIMEENDTDYNHREYDVEEYVEQINNFADASENSSTIIDESAIPKTPKPIADCKDEVNDSNTESIDRQKHLETLFKLNVSGNDNEFISELKSVLLQKVKNYFLEKDEKSKCSLTDDVKKVSDIINRAITDKDSIICDKVHELCLRLRDILVLKDDILSHAMANNVESELNVTNTETENNMSNTPNNTSSTDNPYAKNDNQKKINKYTEDDYNKEEIGGEKITMIHEFNKMSEVKLEARAPQKDSFECLTKFSRIPVAKHKPSKIGSTPAGGPNKRIQRNNHSVRMQNPVTGMKRHVINHSQEADHNHGHVSKRANSKHSKDILQQKEDLIRKAAVLGLIDGIHDIAKIPQLTERAQLALLEKQIQGKLKSKQLALERRKGGLRDRVSNVKLQASKNMVHDSKSGVQKSSKPLAHPIFNSPVNQVIESNVLEIKANSEIESDITTHDSEYTQLFSSSVENSPTLEGQETNKMLLQPENDGVTSIANESNEFMQDKLNFFNPENYNNVANFSKLQSFMPNQMPHAANAMGSSKHENVLKLVSKECTFEDNKIEELNFNETDMPVLKTLTAASVNEKKTVTISESPKASSSHSSERPRAPPPQSRKMRWLSCCLPLLFVVFGVLLYIHHSQMVEYYDQWLIISKNLWQYVRTIEVKEIITEHFGEVRKYVKQKCELL